MNYYQEFYTLFIIEKTITVKIKISKQHFIVTLYIPNYYRTEKNDKTPIF